MPAAPLDETGVKNSESRCDLPPTVVEMSVKTTKAGVNRACCRHGHSARSTHRKNHQTKLERCRHRRQRPRGHAQQPQRLHDAAKRRSGPAPLDRRVWCLRTIGFVNANQFDTLAFDRDKLEFVRGQAPSGLVVPFLIAHDMVVSYQLISGIVRDNSFIGALEGLLNAGIRKLFSWSISPVTFKISYEDWRESVVRITRFDMRLERPNPHYHGDRIVEDLVEGLKAEYGSVQAGARPRTTRVRQHLPHRRRL